MRTMSKQILVRLSQEQNNSIELLLEQFDRKTYPTKSDLIRKLLEVGVTTLQK